MAPVYIGANSAEARDSGLDGTPSRASRSDPLRYAIKIWRRPGHDWIGDRIRATFGRNLQGYNALWLDNSGCGQYNNAAASGHAVYGWNDRSNTKLTADAWGSAQRIKLTALARRFDRTKIIGNSYASSSPCNDRLLSRHVHSGVLENWATIGSWNDAVALSFKIQSNDWPAIYWVRWNMGGGAQSQRFAYGTLLLTLRRTATRFQFGGPWGLSRPDDLMFWKLGAVHGAPTSALDVKIDGQDLYRRAFEHGLVIVNPTAGAQTYQLGSTYYDLVRTSEGLPTAVDSVTIPGRDAAFLLSP